MKKHTNILKAAILVAFVFIVSASLPQSVFAGSLSASNGPVNGKTSMKKNNKDKISKGGSFDNPDFAFPENVEKNAVSRLEEALDKGDGPDALRAAIQVIVARNLVSHDCAEENIRLLDSIAGVMQQPYSSLFYLLEAKLYRQFYSCDSWQYDSRSLPLDTYPDNVNTWSGDLFAKKIMELTGRATCEIRELQTIPLSVISSVLNEPGKGQTNSLSLADFIVSNSVHLLSGLGSRGGDMVIPFRKDEEKQMKSIPEQCEDMMMDLLDRQIEYLSQRGGDEDALILFLVLKSDRIDPDMRIDFLKGWKDRLYDSDSGGKLLSLYYDALNQPQFVGSHDSRSLYMEMKDWLSRYPESVYSKQVKYNIAKLSRGVARITAPAHALPGTPVKGEAYVQNMNDLYVLVYKVPESMTDGNDLKRKRFPTGAKCVASIPLRLDGVVPFSGKLKFEVPALPAGAYVLLPSAKPTLSSDWKETVGVWSLSLTRVSSISLITTSNNLNKKSAFGYVVDARTQEPIEGVKLTIRENAGGRVKSTAVSRKDGSFDLPMGYCFIEATRDDDVAVIWSSRYYNERKDNIRPMAQVFTDLSVYHPGDTLQFSLVGWKNFSEGNELLRDEVVRVYLSDANGTDVNSVRLVTDKWGRCDGRLGIPRDGLLGRFLIYAQFETFKGRAGYNYIEVADYKAPTFFAEIEADSAQVYEAGQVLKFKGSAKTYSGMPLGGAEVKFDVRWMPWWRWWNRSSGNASYGGTLTTNERGEFVIELPTENLIGTRFERGSYTIEVSVTSLSGETQQAQPFRFALGNGLTVNPSVPEKICVKSDSVTFNVPVYDMLDFPTVQEVDYVIRNSGDKSEVLNGRFRSPLLVVASSKLPSGKYELEFNVAGDTLKNKVETVIFRSEDKMAPYATPLWIPESRIVAPAGSEAVKVEFGSGYPGSYILCIVSGRDGIIKREWVKTGNVNSMVTVPHPQDDESIWVTFSGMHNFEQLVSSVSVVNECSLRKMEVKASAFKNKISAGAKERWTFKFNIKEEYPKGIPAIAVMTDKSLNALSPFSWRFNPAIKRQFLSTNVSANNPGSQSVVGNFSKLPNYGGVYEYNPEWNTYNYNLACGGGYFDKFYAGSSPRMMKAAAVRGESVEEAEGQVARLTSMDYSDSVELNEAQVEMSDDMGMVSSEEVVAAGVEDASESQTASGQKDTTQLRPMEMPLAFFMPLLSADDEGMVEVAFDVPDFNTTWQFQIMGYNEELLTAGLMLDAVASKPVMVRSNPPRYLRTGDKAEISALLFNNTDSVLSVGGEIELFDFLTGDVLSSAKFEAEDVEPSGNRVIAMQYDVPSCVNMIGMRAYAVTDRFSDGEQTLLPVLPSAMPEIESTQFYMKPGEGGFSVTLPKYKEDAILTLKYCDNPVWECVFALPSIASPDSKNIMSLMKALYANSMALDVVHRYPRIKDGLKRVLLADNPINLRSNLEKDEELKAVALKNTPWVNDASSETLRMRQLLTLLDSVKSSAAVSSLLKEVKDLQNPDGGWSWCPGMRSSSFMTRNVILLFGKMNKLGIMPSDCAGMISRAIGYCDKESYDNYIKAKRNFSTEGMLNYLYARSFFTTAGDGKPGFSGLRKSALKKISEEWRNFSVYNKALAAVLLSRTRGYEREAGIILESLNQYASKDEVRGWWFDNLSSGYSGIPKLLTTATVLEAYDEIQPYADAVDGLRQWLVLQKETENWGADTYTVEVIQSIMSSGADWTAESEAPAISLGGNVVNTGAVEALTGSFTISIDSDSASGKVLEVNKNSSGPAWGGVISQYVAPIKDVKAEKCVNLSIGKKLLVVRNTPAGEIAEEGEIEVGDKVRVTLTVECEKDMDYVVLVDERAACLESADQMSGYVLNDGLWTYREERDSRTTFFIESLPKGVSVLTYDCYADREGEYALGMATIQSEYSPMQVAHSAGKVIRIGKKSN